MSRLRRRLSLPVPRRVEQRLDKTLDAVLAIQRPAVVAYLDRVRARRPGAPPAEVIDLLQRHYVTAAAGMGAAAGGAAALPGVGTVASLASGAAEVTAFVTTTAMFVLALAEMHGIPVSDPQLRRALVLGVLLGDAGAAAVRGEAAHAPHWAQVIGRARRDQIAGINSRVMRLLVARFGARQGALMLGRALPLGLGAGVGAVGNAALARGVVASAHHAFGPPPATFPPRVLEI